MFFGKENFQEGFASVDCNGSVCGRWRFSIGFKSSENGCFLWIKGERKFINKPEINPLAPSAEEILSLFPLKSERLERKAGIGLINKDGIALLTLYNRSNLIFLEYLHLYM